MSEDRIEELTNSEREALRRWLHRQSAKVIAIELGISHHAVNERLRSARRRLGVRTSEEAARMLASVEGTYNDVVYKPQSVAAAPKSAILASSDEDRVGQHPGAVVREMQRPYTVGTSSERRGWRNLLALGDARDDLTKSQRATIIIVLTVLIILAAGVLVTIGQGLGHVVRAAVNALS